jgi:hypothetical protein
MGGKPELMETGRFIRSGSDDRYETLSNAFLIDRQIFHLVHRIVFLLSCIVVRNESGDEINDISQV